MGPIGASNSWKWVPYHNSYVDINGKRTASVSGGTRWGGGMWINSWDMARFGYLWLRGGAWAGKQILPPAYVSAALAPSAHGPDYGYLWWLNSKGKNFPGLPANAYGALGAGSNTITISPDHELVIVWRWHCWKPGRIRPPRDRSDPDALTPGRGPILARCLLRIRDKLPSVHFTSGGRHAPDPDIERIRRRTARSRRSTPATATTSRRRWPGPALPPGTKSLALIVDDPDAPDPAAPQRTWVHWVLYNIPADAAGLEQGGRHAAGRHASKAATTGSAPATAARARRSAATAISSSCTHSTCALPDLHRSRPSSSSSMRSKATCWKRPN